MTIKTETDTMTPGQKAALTKRTTNAHKAAGIKAQITRAERLRDALTGYAKGLMTKRINALRAELEDLGHMA